jgi:hypothetical protein
LVTARVAESFSLVTTSDVVKFRLREKEVIEFCQSPGFSSTKLNELMKKAQ